MAGPRKAALSHGRGCSGLCARAGEHVSVRTQVAVTGTTWREAPGRAYSAHSRPTSTKDIGKRRTILDLGDKYRKNVPLTMLTAKDFPSAVIIQQVGGIDLILVGDSLGMV